jgi:hypothetical protein
MVNRHHFWQNVDASKPEELSGLFRPQLKYYEKYFLEIQHDPELPGHEKQTASNQVALIHREIDRRRNRWLIPLTIVGLAVAIVFGVLQCRANNQFATPPPSQSGIAAPAAQRVTKAPLSTPRLPAVSPAIPRATTPIPQATPVLPDTSPDAGELGMTLEELNNKYEALNERFGEQEALVTRLNHKKIKWTVEVLSVGKCQAGICVTFISTTGPQFRITNAEFGEEFRERLYALRKGDRIVLEGTLKADPYNSVWYVNSKGFELLPAKGK